MKAPLSSSSYEMTTEHARAQGEVTGPRPAGVAKGVSVALTDPASTGLLKTQGH